MFDWVWAPRCFSRTLARVACRSVFSRVTGPAWSSVGTNCRLVDFSPCVYLGPRRMFPWRTLWKSPVEGSGCLVQHLCPLGSQQWLWGGLGGDPQTRSHLCCCEDGLKNYFHCISYCGKTHIAKLTISALLGVQGSGIKCIHIAVQPSPASISRAFAASPAKTLRSFNDPWLSPPPAPGNHSAAFRLRIPLL